MPFTIQMTKMGHAVTEGTVVKWQKHAGDQIQQGEAVLTVETDKAEVEIESPEAGVLARVLAEEGSVVGVGLPLGEITRRGETAGDAAPAMNPIPRSNAAPARNATPMASKAPASKRIIASPRAKRLATERGLDLTRVACSGPDGLITEDDVRKIGAQSTPAEPQRGGVLAGEIATRPLLASRREKLTRIQSAGARNLSASWNTIPHFVQMVRVDMSRALAARKALNASATRVTVTDVIAAATVLALKENPRVNASFGDGERIIYDQINIGIAVDTPDGLLVPVIHDAGAF